MPKKVARIILVVVMTITAALSMIFIWPVPSFEKERDLPVLYQKIAEYLSIHSQMSYKKSKAAKMCTHFCCSCL